MRKEQIAFDEVAFSSFITLPKSELYDKFVKKENLAGWTFLTSIDDFSKMVSCSEHTS
jgi:hypothetical protein